ncbi:MAG: glycosyltransferase family 2 protein [Pirellulales bacterium]|nr:glycosyltransferase family 2 protein [Pirellulales bacterium]
MPQNQRPLISLVAPCYNESEAFPHLRRELVKLADLLEKEFAVEIVLVDDGSRDETWPQIQEFARGDSRVRGAALSRNFGHQLALTCGYDVARGDAVVCMDADLQDPPEAVVEMVEKWKQGYDVVHAIREQREGETRFKLWTASLFYRTIRGLGASRVKADSGDFRLLSRRALEALRKMGECHRFVRGMVGWVGFKETEIRYRRKARVAGETKYPLRKMVRFAADAIVSFSIIPLRLSFAAAAIFSAVILGYLALGAMRHLIFGGEFATGWPSLMLAVTVLGAANLVCIGILGEYVGRIYEQVKNRPLYFIREMTNPLESAAREPPERNPE